MEQAKDFTVTTFGLLIAFFLPGLIGLYGFSLWNHQAAETFKTFKTSSSNIGLFLLLLMASLAVGLTLTPIRALLYEEVICKSHRPAASLYRNLRQSNRHEGFRTIIDEQYRYHQFWGNSSLAAIPLMLRVTLNCFSASLLLGILVMLAFLAVETVTVWAAIQGYIRYAQKHNALLR
ncbi:hypothetical protein [Streptomyces sp. BK340]|uniref:hypothetical protein n=1 Tax=Streptomyces sp. BK340 TaxID=2572903 RepID=UPI00119ED820|nr:hypothetical protein [Streptomyces sp. BK340]TVZ75377.1 hypothetical protein FB157_1628 [Streptomyces sp. BK340]